MALYYDTIHVFDTPANLATKLKNGMIGYDVTNDRFAFKRLSDGVIKYWENDIDNIYVKNDGSVPITSDFEVQGLLKIKVYKQASEPTLTIDDYFCVWIDTDDANKVYLVYRRGTGDQLVLQFPETP